jgi:pimeloyl-ACP methyl ester carboxylesterase
LVYLLPSQLLPSQRRRGISLIWWAITLGLSPLGWRKLVRAYCRTRPGLYRQARELLQREGARCWVISASPCALVRAQLYQQLPGQLPHRIIGSQMHYRFGGLMPRFYCHGHHKLLPEICALDAELALSDSLHDLPRLTTALVLVAATNDRSISPEVARQVREILPSAVIERLPGLGHLAHEEQPQLITELIMKYAHANSAEQAAQKLYLRMYTFRLGRCQ